MVLFQDDPEMSLDESATFDAPVDIPVPERTPDSQPQADNENSDDERNWPIPSTLETIREKSTNLPARH